MMRHISEVRMVVREETSVVPIATISRKRREEVVFLVAAARKRKGARARVPDMGRGV